MTRQVLAHQPYTVRFTSTEGGALVDTPLTVTGGSVYSDRDYNDRITDTTTDGAGQFTFYAEPGTVITLAADSPIAADVEPVQFVGVTERPGGVAAVHPADTPDVHDRSAVSELVSDASLVGAPIDGDLDSVRVRDNTVIEPGEPVDGTPDGTTATDPDAVSPARPEQVTPVYEPTPDEGGSHMEPQQVQEVPPPEPGE